MRKPLFLVFLELSERFQPSHMFTEYVWSLKPQLPPHNNPRGYVTHFIRMDYYFNLRSCTTVIRCSTSPGAARIQDAWRSRECWENDDNFALGGNISLCFSCVCLELLVKAPAPLPPHSSSRMRDFSVPYLTVLFSETDSRTFRLA